MIDMEANIPYNDICRFEVIEMKWTLEELRHLAQSYYPIHNQFDLAPALKDRQTDIISIEPVEVQGYFSALEDEILFHGEMSGQVTLRSTRTLEPVTIQLHLPIRERYVTMNDPKDIHDYEETTIVLEEDMLVLEDILVDILLAGLPMKVIGPGEEDALPSGSGWQVLTEVDYQAQLADPKEEIDPRFAKLKDLLKEDE